MQLAKWLVQYVKSLNEAENADRPISGINATETCGSDGRCALGDVKLIVDCVNRHTSLAAGWTGSSLVADARI